MNPINMPPIDPNIIDASKKMVAQQKRKKRQQYLKDNLIAIFALVISFLSLVVSTLGLYLQTCEQVSQDQSHVETVQNDQDDLPEWNNDLTHPLRPAPPAGLFHAPSFEGYVRQFDFLVKNFQSVMKELK